MIQTSRVLIGEIETIEDPGWTEEKLYLQTFPGNTKGGEQSPPLLLFAMCHAVNSTAVLDTVRHELYFCLVTYGGLVHDP